MQDETLLRLVEQLEEMTAELARAVKDAVDDQYDKPPVPRTRDEVRPSGGISRPTEDTALDERRQALREAVRASGPAVQAALVMVRGTLRSLQISHDEWRGSDG